ncbi:MAG: ABC transporter ATP-binding protein [Verrucomicrobiota bacterium]
MAEKLAHRKISHKEVGGMSAAEYRAHAKLVYLRLLSYVKPHKMRFAMGVFFGVVSGLFYSILFLVIRVVFDLVLNPNSDKVIRPFEGFKFKFGQNFEFTPPAFITEHDLIFTAFVCGLVPLLMLIKGLLTYLHMYYMLWIGNKVLFRLRDESFGNLVNQSLKFYSHARQGELMQTVFNQTRMASSAGTDLASAMIKHPVSVITILAMLLLKNPVYTFGAVVVFPLCLLPVIYISRKVRKAGGKEEEEAGMLMVTMQEAFSGIKVVKAHAREDFESNRFNKASQRMLDFIMRWRKAIEIVGPLVETVASVGIAVGLVYAKMTGMPTKDFLVLNFMLMAMYPHAKALSRIQVSLQKCIVATSKVFEIIDMKPDVADAPDAIKLKKPEGPLVFNDVSFAYVPGTPAVENVSLTFEPGKFYALVGKSGSGKSTMLSLMMRFYDPTSGSISLGDTDIRKYTQSSLRDQMGLVLQETFLFHDSIYNNILYGRLDATKDEVVAAAKMAHSHEFIMEKEKGYDTVCGDKGAQLSGGQQQRLSIARSILRNAPILLLDEAMSSLDSESEKKVQEAIEKLEKGKTVIAIAHRLSTILNADQIIVMDQGRVEAVGPHKELLEKSAIYKNLYNLQFHNHQEKTTPS